ncbi:MAG: hypothetical protein CMO81_00620 [Waddliaceae bacterium]|nr:hypothetical protein [Waddliaceae bacterium]
MLHSLSSPNITSVANYSEELVKPEERRTEAIESIQRIGELYLNNTSRNSSHASNKENTEATNSPCSSKLKCCDQVSDVGGNEEEFSHTELQYLRSLSHGIKEVKLDEYEAKAVRDFLENTLGDQRLNSICGKYLQQGHFPSGITKYALNMLHIWTFKTQGLSKTFHLIERLSNAIRAYKKQETPQKISRQEFSRIQSFSNFFQQIDQLHRIGILKTNDDLYFHGQQCRSLVEEIESTFEDHYESGDFIVKFLPHLNIYKGKLGVSLAAMNLFFSRYEHGFLMYKDQNHRLKAAHMYFSGLSVDNVSLEQVLTGRAFYIDLAKSVSSRGKRLLKAAYGNDDWEQVINRYFQEAICDLHQNHQKPLENKQVTVYRQLWSAISRFAIASRISNGGKSSQRYLQLHDEYFKEKELDLDKEYKDIRNEGMLCSGLIVHSIIAGIIETNIRIQRELKEKPLSERMLKRRDRYGVEPGKNLLIKVPFSSWRNLDTILPGDLLKILTNRGVRKERKLPPLLENILI